ncbi:hypothetical protein ACH5RR_009246 [Cinchona calisaya]|uniref:Uncharacterized protein n=1 Tax=Cinchona calisaya TaxID=153742 RepID=A0ABD3AFE6_9GENT
MDNCLVVLTVRGGSGPGQRLETRSWAGPRLRSAGPRPGLDIGPSTILSGLKQHSKTSKGMLEAKFGGKIPLKNLGPQKKYSRMEDYFDGSNDDDYYDRVYDDDEEVEGEDSDGLQETKDENDFSMSCD